MIRKIGLLHALSVGSEKGVNIGGGGGGDGEGRGCCTLSLNTMSGLENLFQPLITHC